MTQYANPILMYGLNVFSNLCLLFKYALAGLCASRAFVCFVRVSFLSFFFSSSWCWGLAAVCDCGTPWTFLLTLCYIRVIVFKRLLR